MGHCAIPSIRAGNNTEPRFGERDDCVIKRCVPQVFGNSRIVLFVRLESCTDAMLRTLPWPRVRRTIETTAEGIVGRFNGENNMWISGNVRIGEARNYTS